MGVAVAVGVAVAEGVAEGVAVSEAVGEAVGVKVSEGKGVAVGGCVISAPELRFGTPGRPPVRFKTGSWQTLGLLQLGFARAAWWGANGFYTNYGIPANARNNQWNEVAAWIETAPGQTYPLYAEHRTDRSVPYQIATAVCSEDGKGSVTYPTN